MEDGLTDDDRQRISKFLSEAKYKREPEMLIPDDGPA